MDNLEKALGEMTIGRSSNHRSSSRSHRSSNRNYSNSSGEKERKRLLRRTNRVTIKVSRRGSEREAWKRAKDYMKDGYKITEIKLAKKVD